MLKREKMLAFLWKQNCQKCEKSWKDRMGSFNNTSTDDIKHATDNNDD